MSAVSWSVADGCKGTMRFEEIHAQVGDVPFIVEENARFLYDLVLAEGHTDILELGIAHGTATCYMAAALHELGRGQVTAVDLIEVKDAFSPSAEEQLRATGLGEFASVVRMQSGYNWFLHDEIARNTADGVCREAFDLCIIDGPKNWTIDGAAFFLADKLLRRDGWIIFDDYDWTYASVEGERAATDGITHRGLSDDELRTPHISEIFELLVRQHPSYGKLMLFPDTGWALAQKTASAEKVYDIVYRRTTRDIVARSLLMLHRAARRAVRS